MTQLVAPTVRLHTEWLEVRAEWGPGLHEDGSGLASSDEVETAEGFAPWVTRLLDHADPATAQARGQLTGTHRWIVEGGRVRGGIALRHGQAQKVQQIGHIGYGIRPLGPAPRPRGRWPGFCRSRGCRASTRSCSCPRRATSPRRRRSSGSAEGV